MLTIALPSKGRLKQDTENYFRSIGLHIKTDGGGRDYQGYFADLPNHQILFLQASEIARRLADGSIDVGVTGLDLMAENQALETVFTFKKLDFGYADLVFTVPETWIDVQSMRDIDDITFFFRKTHGIRFRVATKYLNLTAEFLKKHGIKDYRLVESQGATEGAPAAGIAEAVVDITSTGSTLKANALKIIPDGVMLKSQALFMGSLTARWTDSKKDVLKHILDYIMAHKRAQLLKLVHGHFAESMKSDILEILLSVKAQDIDLSETNFRCLIEHHKIDSFSHVLRSTGVESLIVSDVSHVYRTECHVYDEFSEKIDNVLEHS